MHPDTSKSGNDQARRHGALRFIKEKKYYLLISLMLLPVFLAGAWYGGSQGSRQASAGKRRILHYVDPMNPAHTSPEPGLAPCGMKMEPVYAEEGGELPPPFLPPGAVKITPRKQQLIGVRLGTVEKAPYTHTLRALARVAIDETRIYQLNSFVNGWIQNTYANSTGSLVLKDEVLVSYYSKDILNEVQMYITALTNLERIVGDKSRQYNLADFQVRLRQAEDTLKTLGMSDAQVLELAKTRISTQDIFLGAPVTSFVISRKVSPGQKISKGDELFKLADLSRVWIVADLYENEAPFIKPGLKVRAKLPYRRDAFQAVVTDIHPEFDKASRTLRVRLETDNPDYTLKPDMFVDVEFPVRLPETVTVPVDAVMDTGLKKTVFVDRGKGYFEPRRVETGWRLGGRVQITKGLKPGERIVISGNFLVDSESRMKLAAAGFAGEAVKDPACGMNVDASKAKAAGLETRINDTTTYFCSEDCQNRFLRHPERYLAEKTGGRGVGEPAAAAPVLVKDPVCGLEVDQALARAKGLKSEYQGKTYYFCRYYCNRQFDKDPGRYIKEKPEGNAHHKHEQAQPLIVKDPVCGLEVNRDQASARRLKRIFGGKTYYFCRDYCARQFDKAPASYLPKDAPAWAPPYVLPAKVVPTITGPKELRKKQEALEGIPGEIVDPVCLLKLKGDQTQNPHKTFFRGKVYYFCTDRCKEVFDRAPSRYLTQQSYDPNWLSAKSQMAPGAVGAKGDKAAPANQNPQPGLQSPKTSAQKDAAPQIAPWAVKARGGKPIPAGPGPQPGAQVPKTPAQKDAEPVVTGEKGKDPHFSRPMDPVCGILGHGKVRPLSFKSTYQGKTYHFCSKECKEDFDKNPQAYIIYSQEPAQPRKEKQAPPPKGEKPATSKLKKAAVEKMTKKPAASKATPKAAPGAKGKRHD